MSFTIFANSAEKLIKANYLHRKNTCNVQYSSHENQNYLHKNLHEKSNIHLKFTIFNMLHNFYKFYTRMLMTLFIESSHYSICFTMFFNLFTQNNTAHNIVHEKQTIYTKILNDIYMSIGKGPTTVEQIPFIVVRRKGSFGNFSGVELVIMATYDVEFG
jgi:hypothetical protein